MRQDGIKKYTWQEIVEWALKHSSYYKKLYQGIFSFEKLSNLPIINQDDFWKANTIHDNRVLTSAAPDGIVFKSGGTTGNPKFSVFSREEWSCMVRLFGEGMSRTGILEGDRVGNLFYVGDLYGSFIFIMRSLEEGPVPVLQFPIGGGTPIEVILKTIQDFKLNVLVGPPTTLLSAAAYYSENRSVYPEIRIQKLLYGGESVYQDQREQLQSVFPGVKISSVGYASVDAGLLGYADADCELDEHKSFSKVVILEILDEDTGEPIHEINQPGKLVATSLMRRLMPIIRYPVGDRAEWKEVYHGENQDRKFRLLGRAEDAARVGPLSVYYEDMRSVMEQADPGVQISGFQFMIYHKDRKDGLVVRIAIQPEEDRSLQVQEKRLEKLKNAWEKILNCFNQERSAYLIAVERNLIHPMEVEWTTLDKMGVNPRTGKLRRILDLRK
jgi:phenylacetate-CoA ligase